MTYQVFGLSDEHEPVLLEENSNVMNLMHWCRGYTRHGDWGGYHTLRITDFNGETYKVYERNPDAETDR